MRLHRTEADTEEAMGLRNPKNLRRLGIVLYVLSFPMPTWNFEGFGIAAFIMTPWAVATAFHEMLGPSDWQAMLLGTGLLVGWLSNATVFFRLPSSLAWCSIAAPWIALVSEVFFSHYHMLDTRVLAFIPFYPWAIGLGLIHYSRLMEQPSGWLAWLRAQARGT